MSETQPAIMGGWYCGNRAVTDRQGRGFPCPEQGCAKGFCARDAGWTPGAGTIECVNSSAATGWKPANSDHLYPGTKIEFGNDLRQGVTLTQHAVLDLVDLGNERWVETIAPEALIQSAISTVSMADGTDDLELQLAAAIGAAAYLIAAAEKIASKLAKKGLSQ